MPKEKDWIRPAAVAYYGITILHSFLYERQTDMSIKHVNVIFILLLFDKAKIHNHPETA
jgi:hypothetical protein